MIHNLTPKPTKVWITYDIDFIPASSPAAQRHQAGAADLDGRAERQHLPGLRRAQGHAARTASTPTPTTPTDLRAAARRRTSGPSTATACSSPPPATSTPAACTTTSGCSATRCRAGADGTARSAGHPDTAHLFRSVRQVLRAGGRGVVGRGDDGHPAGLARRGAEGRHALDHRHLRHQARVVVRVDGDHGRVDGRRHRRQGPVHDRGRRDGPAHPRPPARERQPRRRARPEHYADLTQAAVGAGTRRRRSRSRTSSTRAAT